MAHLWKRFSFFDERTINHAGVPPHALHAGSGPAALVFACADGWVQVLDSGLRVIRAFRAHAGRALYARVLQHRPMVLTVGEEEEIPGKPYVTRLRVKIWDLDTPPGQELNPSPTPHAEIKVVHPSTQDPEPGQTRVRAVAAAEPSADSVSVAVGLTGGQVLMVQRIYTYRSSSVRWMIAVPPSPRFTGQGVGPGRDGPPELPGNDITWLGYSERELRAEAPGAEPGPGPQEPPRLFCVTDGQTLSLGTTRDDASDIVVLELRGVPEGQATACAVRTGAGGDLAVVRGDTISLYGPEVRHPESPYRKDTLVIEGLHPAVGVLGHRLAVVQRVSGGQQGQTTQASAAAASDSAAAAPPVVQLAVYDPRHKLVAAVAPLPTNFSPRFLLALSNFSAIAALPNDNEPRATPAAQAAPGSPTRLPPPAAKVLVERPLASQLEAMVARQLYSLASDVAVSGGASDTVVSDIERRHADFLHSKGEFGEAALHYAHTVGHLEPSYVVRRFLDARRPDCLVTYLEALQAKGLAGPDHCNLLLQCYTMLSHPQSCGSATCTNGSGSNWDSAPPAPHPNLERLVSDSVAAWRSGKASGIEPSAAIKVLRQAGYPDLALRLAEAVSDSAAVLEILLGVGAGGGGAGAAATEPDPDRALKYLATLPVAAAVPLVHRYGRRLVSWRPEGTTALIAGLCAASAEAEGGKPSRNHSNQKGTSAAKYADFLPLFAHRPESLMLFCEFALHSASTTDVEGGATLRRTLLELYLSDTPAPPGAAPAPSAALPPTAERRSRALELLRTGWAPGRAAGYDTDEALVLCRARGFLPGVRFLYERMGRPGDALRAVMEAGDVEGLIEACQRVGDASAWAEALAYLAQRPGPDSTPIVLRVLEGLQSAGGVRESEPLSVIRALGLHPGVELKHVRPLLDRHFSGQAARIRDDANAVASLNVSVRALSDKLESLRAEPRVFQSPSCALTGAPLELPTVHFLCGHSFNLKALGEADQECPLCRPQRDATLRVAQSVARQGAATAVGADGDRFFAELRGRQARGEDGFEVFSEAIGRGVLGIPLQ